MQTLPPLLAGEVAERSEVGGVVNNAIRNSQCVIRNETTPPSRQAVTPPLTQGRLGFA